MYLVSTGHKKLCWEPRKEVYSYSHNTIISTEEIIVEACKQLNQIKETHAS